MPLSDATYQSKNPKTLYYVILDLIGIDGDTFTLRLSDLPLNSDSTFPSSGNTDKPFFSRLEEPLSYSRDTVDNRLGGRSNFRGGEIVFNLNDASILFPSSCSVIGSGTEITPTTQIAACGILNETELSRGALTSLYNPGGQDCFVSIYDSENNVRESLYSGKAVGWFAEEQGRVTVTLDGNANVLDTTLQRATYGGTGGLDGETELEGLRRPVALGGDMFNVTPVLVIESERLYEVHTDVDGNGAEVNDIPNIYIGGIGVTIAGDDPDTATLRAASISAGEARTCIAEGRFRLGSDAGSDVTCDVQGAVFGGVHVTTPRFLIRKVLDFYGTQIGKNYANDTSLTTLNTERGYDLARYIGPNEELTLAGFFDEIAASTESAWGDNQFGKLEFTVIKRPSGSTTLTFDENDIVVNSFEILEMPREVYPAVSDYTVEFDKDYTFGSEVTDPYTATFRFNNRIEYRRVSLVNANASSYSGTIEARFPTAKSITVRTLIDNQTDALAHANDLVDLYDGTIKRVRFATKIKGFQVNLGDTVTVKNEEEDFDGVILVTGIEVTTSDNEVVIEGIYDDS